MQRAEQNGQLLTRRREMFRMAGDLTQTDACQGALAPTGSRM